MKFTATAATAVALLSAPLVQALPSSGVQKGSTGMLPIRDVARLAELEARHNATLADMKAGAVRAVDSQDSEQGLTKRNPLALVGFGGMFLRSPAGRAILDRISERLKDVLDYESNEIWFNEDRCRASFRTQGGGNEGFWTYDKGYGYWDPSGSHEFNAGWIDPANNDPPVHYYHDEGVGDISIQFTATGEHAWDGIDGTKKCGFQGLCNPQIVMYRDDYELIINTWQSQGSKAECYYSDGERCGGLCKSGVKDQFASGGMKWAGDCAIPCYSETSLE